jgi:tetratricopeptide (TPR) repeat protein
MILLQTVGWAGFRRWGSASLFGTTEELGSRMLKRILAGVGIFAIIAAFAIPAIAVEQPSERRARLKLEAQKLPNQGDEALSKKDYDRAIQLYTKGIDSGVFADEPQTLGRLHFGRGSAYHAKGDCITAVVDYVKATEYAKKGDYYYNAAACHITLQQLDLALGDLDNAVKIDPDAIAYRSARCKLLFNKKDFAGAIPDCEKALAGAPNDKDLMVATAQAAEQTNNRQRAAEVYRQLLAADPGNAIATEGLKRVGG